MKIAICDDLESDRKVALKFINHYIESKNYDAVSKVLCYSSAEKLLADKANIKSLNLIFLDIYMDKMNGMECAQKLRKLGCDCQIIFTTTSKDFALDAFRVKALDYLVKPYKYDDFCNTMDVVMQRFSHSLKHIEVTCNYEKRIIYLHDIYYIETEGRNTVIFTKDENLRTIRTMQNYTDILCSDKNFYRCHRCCIVNFNHVLKCYDDYFKFDNGAKIYLKTRNKADAKNAFYNYQFASLDD